MRYLVLLAVLIVAQLGAAWATSEPNVARPGGVFATVEAETPAACERLCADDTLCMAWSFSANSCELKAIVPAAIAREGVTSGVSRRAPAALRASFEPPPPPAVAIEADAGVDLTASEPAPPEDDVSLALLGGPESDEELRTRLGN